MPTSKWLPQLPWSQFMVALWIMFAACSSLPARTPAPAKDSLRNTLVTGVVVNKKCEDNTLNDAVRVRIYKNGVRIAEVETCRGMFVKDLQGQASPEDLIEVVVWRGRDDDSPVHSGKTVRTYLQYAQNIVIPIGYRHKAYGCYRRSSRTLFINNI